MTCAAEIAAASRADAFQMWRFALDCDPKTYSCTSSGRKDAQIAHIKSGARLEQHPPRYVKSR